jgi:hypothetical protein
MKLCTYFRSSAAYRVRIALALKELNCDYMPVHVQNRWHRDWGGQGLGGVQRQLESPSTGRFASAMRRPWPMWPWCRRSSTPSDSTARSATLPK